jgi:hypothetical protein
MNRYQSATWKGQGESWLQLDCTTIFMILAVFAVVFFILSPKRRSLVKRTIHKARRKLSEAVAQSNNEHHQEGFGEVSPAPFSPESSQPILVEPSNGLDLCHPKCCCDTQWPVPNDVSGPGASVDEQTLLRDYDKTPLHCRGCNGRGCLCSKKSDSGVLPTCGSVV